MAYHGRSLLGVLVTTAMWLGACAGRGSEPGTEVASLGDVRAGEEDDTPGHEGPRLAIEPAEIDLGDLPLGYPRMVDARLINTGAADVRVTGFRLEASRPSFRVLWEGEAYGPDAIPLDPPLVLPPGATRAFAVQVTPNAPLPLDATLTFFSNDPEAPKGTTLRVWANQTLPCIEVQPASLDFGAVPVGQTAARDLTIRNCSPAGSLRLLSVGILDQNPLSVKSFGIDSLQPSATPLWGEPAELAPGDTAALIASFHPWQAPEPWPAGLLAERATVTILSNAAATGQVDIPLTGVALDPECPRAIVTVEEGSNVAPQTVVHLHGEGSLSPKGAITKYAWSVEAPADALPPVVASFIPTPSFPAPIYEMGATGRYTFALDVWDETGARSCLPGQAIVWVDGPMGLLVELTWQTPGDPNQSDEGPEMGADLDLHVAHPNAVQYDLDGDGIKDPWFDPQWDVFWFYPDQNWGDVTESADNPRMERDDVDGLGPEQVHLEQPEEGLTYAVGVNVFDDHGFGVSFATVRVFRDATLVFEAKDQALIDRDLWWVADVAWPSGEVTAKRTAEGQVWITHDYHHPLFYQP